jgi:hypothetical protein
MQNTIALTACSRSQASYSDKGYRRERAPVGWRVAVVTQNGLPELLPASAKTLRVSQMCQGLREDWSCEKTQNGEPKFAILHAPSGH